MADEKNNTAELFEELTQELPFIPDEEAKQGLINAFIYALLF